VAGRVAVFGSFMMDLLAYVSRRPRPGETVIGNDFKMMVGGKGFNQAVAAARAGAEVDMIGRVGQDAFGDSFLRFLADEGINANHVARDPDQGTGVGLPVVEPDGTNAIVIVPRANYVTTPADVRQSANTIAAADVLLLQLEVDMHASAEAAAIAKAAGTTVVLNPAPGDTLLPELVTRADILVPNEIEAHHLANRPAGSDETVVARALLDLYELQAVLLTIGDRGVIVATPKDTVHVPASPFLAVDTVGAGDTFCGAFAAAISEGQRLDEAVAFGNIAAGISVTRHGGAPAAPHREEIDRHISIGSSS
jgi:ribokinase